MRDTMPASIEEGLRSATHVNFGFAYDSHAIFVIHYFSSCKRDSKMRKHSAFRRREEIICDKSNGLHGGVSRKVIAHG